MNIRELALRSMLAICKEGAYSNIVVSQTIQKYALTDRDRRFYTELVYGTLRHMNYLDWIISQLSTRRIAQLDPVCLAVLRLGMYQIFGMTKVPESAACNESVTLASRFGNRGMAKFVNALLRGSIRRREEWVIPTMEENKILHLALTYHQQEWLIRKWLHDYGDAETEELCRYFDTIPDLCLRTNTTRISRTDLLQQLQEQRLEAVPAEYSPEGIYIKGNPAIKSIRALRDGLAIIQDEPSQLVAHAVAPAAGDVVFDVCAAPGGKTTHLAALGGASCVVYGGDIHAHKLKLIEHNANVLGLTNIRTMLQDAAVIGRQYAGKADRVLVDAPCSGLGVLRRKLDLRWRKTQHDVEMLPSLQRKILESAAACVKPGGVLVYSTCTMNEEENTGVIRDFLQTHTEFHTENAAALCRIDQPGPYVQLLPQRDHLDGFFIARMKKEI